MSATTDDFVSTKRGQAAGSHRLPARAAEYRGVRPYRRRWGHLKRLAEPHMKIWRVLNEFMYPWSGRYLWSDTERDEIWRGDRIKNSVIFEAIRTCASGLHGGLTSPARPWFEIAHPDEEAMENQRVKEWLHAVQAIMRSVLARSNFYAGRHGSYMENLVYGPSACVIDPHKTNGVLFRDLTIGEYFMANGADGKVNTLYRRMEMTTAQLREEFGADNPGFSQAIRDALRHGRLDDPTWTVVHAMQPIGHFGGEAAGKWTYESVYFLEKTDAADLDSEPVLLRKLHRTQPFVAVRWAKVGDDVYGYSPGMMALADNKMLQTKEKDYIDAVEMALKPPITGHTSLQEHMFKGGLRPGQFVPDTGTGAAANGLRAVYNVNFDFNNTRQKIAEVTENIKNKFYNNLFLSILFNQKQMTATEVAQRLEEKAMVLGPVLESFQAEQFDPTLDREFNILDEEFGVIPPPPDEIAGDRLKIEYVGQMAMSMKQVGLTNITSALPLIMQVVELDPGAAIKLNGKEFIDEIGRIYNFGAKLLRSDEECEEIEAAQQQAAAQQQQMAELQQASDMAQQLGNTPMGQGSALDALTGGGDGSGA